MKKLKPKMKDTMQTDPSYTIQVRYKNTINAVDSYLRIHDRDITMDELTAVTKALPTALNRVLDGKNLHELTDENRSKAIDDIFATCSDCLKTNHTKGLLKKALMQEATKVKSTISHVEASTARCSAGDGLSL